MLNIVACSVERSPPEASGRSEPPPATGWPLISIVTPSLNRAAFIKAAIESVVAQNYPAFEHIIVDGGSTDKTREVLAAYPHLRVVSEPDRGSHHAMNKGLALATGQIVGFLNTDDVYAPGIFHAVAREMAGGHVRFAAGRCFFFSSTERGEPVIEAELRHVGEPSLYLDELCYATPGFNSYFFDRSLLAMLGAFNEAFDVAADRDLLLRAAVHGLQPKFLPRAGYYYRRHPGSRTLDKNARLGAAILADHRAIARKLLTMKLPSGARRKIRQWCAWETARLISFYFAPHALSRAMRILIEAAAYDPVWPGRLLGARAATLHLKASYK